MTTQQFCAIVSAAGVGRATITVNMAPDPDAAETYERTIALLEAAGEIVERSAHTLAGTSMVYELALVNPDAHGGSDLSIIGPFGHVGYQPDERIAPTSGARLSVMPGGAA